VTNLQTTTLFLSASSTFKKIGSNHDGILAADDFVIKPRYGLDQKFKQLRFDLLTNLSTCFSSDPSLNFGYDGENPNSFMDSLLKDEKSKTAVMIYDE
jgi:hypothetical protein